VNEFGSIAFRHSLTIPCTAVGTIGWPSGAISGCRSVLTKFLLTLV
jgi:hypothetical protein